MSSLCPWAKGSGKQVCSLSWRSAWMLLPRECYLPSLPWGLLPWVMLSWHIEPCVNMSRVSGPTTLMDLLAGSRCPFSCMDIHQSSIGQAPPATWGTSRGRQGRKGAWHTLVDTFVLVKEGFLCGFHPVLFLLALSQVRYCK